MSSNLRIISPSGAAYRHVSGVWGPRAGQWLPFGTGMDGNVYAVAPYAGGLVAVGEFGTAGGVTVRGVAFWNGSAWSALGGGVGLDGTGTTANAIAVYGGNLYIGGLFNSVNGVSAPYIAMWNGSTWSAVGSSINGTINSMYVFGGLLYVGGSFTSPGTFIATWNGSTWSDASSGVSAAPINSFTEHSSALHHGGGSAGGSVQSFGGGSWSDVGTVPGGGVFAVQSFGGDLYAGGNFTEIDSVTVDRLAKYDGSWSAVGNANNAIDAMHIWDSQLVIGGVFTNIASRVARYNGSTFTAFGDGLNGQVAALTTYNGYLVAGGQFTASGAATRNRIAYWSIPETP